MSGSFCVVICDTRIKWTSWHQPWSSAPFGRHARSTGGVAAASPSPWVDSLKAHHIHLQTDIFLKCIQDNQEKLLVQRLPTRATPLLLLVTSWRALAAQAALLPAWGASILAATLQTQQDVPMMSSLALTAFSSANPHSCLLMREDVSSRVGPQSAEPQPAALDISALTWCLHGRKAFHTTTAWNWSFWHLPFKKKEQAHLNSMRPNFWLRAVAAREAPHCHDSIANTALMDWP